MDDLFCGNFVGQEQYDRSIGKCTLCAAPVRFHDLF